MSYQAPLQDIRFQLEHIVGYDRLETQFPDADIETAMMMLEQAGKIAQEQFLPLRRPMDLEPMKLVGDQVKSPEGVGAALNVLGESGLIGIAASEDHDGLGFPLVMQIASNEFLASANLALQLCPLLTQGQIEALEAHASEYIKAEILPKLISGEWTGTMLLTEPSAGTDVGALKSKATRNNDQSYSLYGQKIFITWGEHSHAENISHLALARLPDAAEGAKGISLFYVPKFLQDGARNKIKCIGLEHKLGLHGSPTCVMEMDGAKGFLVGEENNGLAAMFTMMNNARLNVGVQGVAIAEAAFQDAADFARERVQGRVKGGATGKIIDHADVRRMLLDMKTKARIGRAIALDCAIALDLGKSDPIMAARAGVLTPLAKSYGTDVGCENAHECVQVYGGMGFVEETGVAQYYRDARVTPIYEGTNGVQAMDLVGRKMQDKGAAIFALIEEMTHASEDAKTALRNATQSLLERDMNARGADAVAYQRGFASVLGSHYLAKGAISSDEYAKISADFNAREVPAQIARLQSIANAPRDVYALNAEQF